MATEHEIPVRTEEQHAGRIVCPHCGNDDPAQLDYCDWVLTTMPLGVGSTTETLLLGNGAAVVDWNTSQDPDLFCRACSNHFPLPGGIIVDWEDWYDTEAVEGEQHHGDS